jgi:3-hydroxybutyryl-CoA dehydrogenase
MKEILILGTGKMARNIGLFFLRNDCNICWISRDTERAESFASKIKKNVKRLSLVLDKSENSFYIHVCDITKIPRKKYDLILESVNEDLDQKREVIQQIDYLLEPTTILASNSSSSLPSQIHESAIGLHFFYPVELTGLVELIDSNQNLELISTLKSWNLHPIIQSEHNAFAVNRLLLPMQAEAFRLLQKGYPAEMINECSKSDQIRIGQLELMDSIGLDILLPAIKNYVSRMPLDEQNNYDKLIEGINVLIQDGKLGKKNKNGIMMGDPLPWNGTTYLSKEYDKIRNKFSGIFNNTYYEFIERKKIQKGELDIVLKSIF